MSFEGVSRFRNCDEFVLQAALNVADDTPVDEIWTPALVRLGADGATTTHETDGSGTDYYFSQLDYLRGAAVVASRMVAEIPSGGRTELAYWSVAAPNQLLKVHLGLGALILGDTTGRTVALVLDEFRAPEVTLPSGHFYAIQAAHGCSLTVSGLYGAQTDWDALEATFLPTDEQVEMPPEGVIAVPEDFRARFLN